MKTRWVYLASALVLNACWVGASSLGRTVWNASEIGQQMPADPRQEQEPESPRTPNAEKKALEDNDKDMKKKVDRLFELATELKAEVDKTDSSKVLSLNLMKKAEEIEKLARDIKNKSKG